MLWTSSFATIPFLFNERYHDCFNSWPTFRPVLESTKDLSESDSCFDSWINFLASAIKKTVFLFSSLTLRRNIEDSSSILPRNEDAS